MITNNMVLHSTIISVIGKAARVLTPCAGVRRHARQGSDQESESLIEVKSKSRGGVTDFDTASRTDSDIVTSSPSSVLTAEWKPAGVQASLPRSPLVDQESDKDEPTQDKADRIMDRSRDLPNTWYYSSNHVMVNRERSERTIALLVRMPELDEIAREHAEAMAKENRKFHSDPTSLKMKLSQPARRLGENVAKGGTIREIHRKMMTISSDAYNILNSCYSHFGMATAKASDGELYICQIFRG